MKYRSLTPSWITTFFLLAGGVPATTLADDPGIIRWSFPTGG